MNEASGLPLWHWRRAADFCQQVRLSRWRAIADRAIALSNDLRGLADHELSARGNELRASAALGAPLASLVPQAGALVREASRRELRLEHFPVQIMGGVAMFEGFIAEMQTGEGKTLTAILPLFLRALAGKGCHAITANDYLARRDARIVEPVFLRLGMTVGCLQNNMAPEARRAAYRQDVTYSTASELGFDFLRDRLQSGGSERDDFRFQPFGTGPGGGRSTQRGHHFALIDEADSILIDEARTPLIIGTTESDDATLVSMARWCSRAVLRFDEAIDFLWSHDQKAARLTDRGHHKLILMGRPPLLEAVDASHLIDCFEQALTAQHGFQKDRDYVVQGEHIAIVDESTGRVMDGRQWQAGLHQAIEAKEGLPITTPTGQAACVTMQEYFRRYDFLAGMTGTASPVRGELRNVYELKVATISTHRPCCREAWPTRIFRTSSQRSQAVARSIELLRSVGRSTLVGTPSVDASEAMSLALSEHGVPHEVLNAKSHSAEAEIIASAGQPGRVTIATNMAGRGTDIHLHDDVRAAGGLHVFLTEMHSAGRIDRQLIGRSARQGDPGSYQFCLSLDDELLQCLGETAARWKSWPSIQKQNELPPSTIRLFQKAQRHLESLHARDRRMMLKHAERRQKACARMGLDPCLDLVDDA